VGPERLERLKSAIAGHYQFERELGAGAFATVFLARDLRLERLVAIKVLNLDPGSDVNEIRFLREIRYLASLQHPNIVPVHDSGHVEELLYYVMPYVRGESLRERINRERQLAVSDAIRITAEICDALDCAHKAGVIHRDIKPENILLSGAHPMLADFGVARAINVSRGKRLTHTGLGSPGTPAYMSPEQMIGGREPDSRTDIYSLGCVLYEMLTGKAPFEGPGGFVQRFTEPAPSARAIRSDVSPALDQVVRKALGRTPEERYGTAEEIGVALAEAGRAAAIPAPQGLPDKPARSMHLPRSARGVALTVIGALTLIVAAVAANVISRPKKGDASASENILRHVAVLYFDDLSPEKRLAHVAAGLTENLIDQLSQVAGLRVISPNGVRTLRDSVLPIDTIARRLNAGTIVGGSVSRSGATLRLTVRLIDGKTGEQFHSKTFERPSWDFFTLQDSLTTDVAFSLRERLGTEIRLREQKSVANSLESWELVHRGEDLTRQGSALIRVGDAQAPDVLRRADSAYARAESLDPKWVIPTVNRARNALIMAFIEPDTPRLIRVALERAIAHSNRALSKRAESPEALAVRGESRLRLVTFGRASRPDSLLRLARSDLQKAASARPDLARTWVSLGDLYLEEGRYSEAADAYKTAYDADAFLTEIRAVTQMLIVSNLSAGKFDHAQRWCRGARTRFPEDPRFVECELVVLGWSGNTRTDVAEAWRQLKTIEATDSAGMLGFNTAFRRMMVAAVLARAGLRDSARAVVADARKSGGNMDSSVAAEAYVHVLLDQPDQAIRLLSQLLGTNPQLRAIVARNPWFKELRGDSRFQSLVSDLL
jgi:serine/threonine-protein kinase